MLAIGEPVVVLDAEDAARMNQSGRVRIEPDALYDALEVAMILRVKGKTDKGRMNAVYRISEAELLRTPVGPNGGLLRWRGRDILAFLESRSAS